MTRHPLPSTGSPGVGSPASAVLRRAPSPGRPSRRTSFPSLGGTARALVLRSRGRRARRSRAWAVQPGCPSRLFRTETTRSPRFLRSPDVRMPRSPTPASSSRPAFFGVSTRPSVFLTTSALAGIISRGSITRPAHSLCTLRSADHSATTQHSVPAGGQPLPGGTGHPLCTIERFPRSRLHLFPLSQASPGARRVAPGSRPPGAPTDPDVRDSRIRLFRSWVRCTTIDGVDGDGCGERIAFLQPLELRPGHVRPSASAIQPLPSYICICGYLLDVGRGEALAIEGSSGSRTSGSGVQPVSLPT